ncbi:hypothetical protein [Fibrella aquatilis]|uniref:BAAT / Acyl-CoA thioester hydrolase C terminal n=1 Tax=Fibrella aquatilis TaxID=2817059 RepID=A0A939JXJ9_9BACT|nr:hypothetical protein [Fibrella aquatilis]MBO0933037.1 hypothetical protein [Fibrella aquatilis]
MKQVPLLTLFFMVVTNAIYGQHTVRYVGTYTTFTIPFESDSITFAVVAGKGELIRKKPIFLFRQGSLPIPLFELKPKSKRPLLTELPATCDDHQADQYSIIIAKPGVPLLVHGSYLDSLFNTRNNPIPSMYPPRYLQHNYLDYYVRQTNAVLAFVLKQPWADSRRVVIAGGSEGYHVAIKTAYTNSVVTHLIAFSGHLEGRMNGQIREARMRGFTREDSPAETQRNIEELQQTWSAICRDSLNTTIQGGDPYRTTYSFSHNNNLNYLLSLKIPILIIYGTADIGATSNDILPLEFARRGKTNLTVKPYIDHDHVYYKLTYGTDGKVVSKEYNGVAVERDYFEWIRTH